MEEGAPPAAIVGSAIKKKKGNRMKIMENSVSKGKFWTTRYAVINTAYFMGFCGVHAYASIFMLERGFTNSQIGILIALANILSVLIQPVPAGLCELCHYFVFRFSLYGCNYYGYII